MSAGLRGPSFGPVIARLSFDSSFLLPEPAPPVIGPQAEGALPRGRSAEGSLALPLEDSSLIGLPQSKKIASGCACKLFSQPDGLGWRWFGCEGRIGDRGSQRQGEFAD
jgi:hypothetical protein